MKSVRKPHSFVLWMGFGLIFLTGCATAPQPTGEHIVSVSIANNLPTPIPFIEVKLCGSEPAVVLQGLSAYTEKSISSFQPVFNDCVSRLKIFDGANKPQPVTFFLPEPFRQSKTGEYNLRIQLSGSGSPPKISLEPIRLFNARRRNQKS